MPFAAGAALLALAATPAVAMLIGRVPLVPEDSKLPGRHADGSVQLINQRTVTPAGQQSDLGDLPLNAILSPDGRHLLVTNSGAVIQSLQVVDTSNGKVVQETKYFVPDSVFIGLTYSPDGKKVYASGGGSNLVHTFSVGREADRVAEWKREFDQFVANNSLPQLEIMRLPNDHTSGTTPGRLTPQAYVAENDLAVGQVVDIVSHSKYWASTAIFVTEDDAQNGPDHVDSHRTTSLVISPYVSRGEPFVDHTLYDTAAMMRTMELILGLAPLSQFDANATPIRHLFRRGELSEDQLAPYTALAESVSTTSVNASTAFGAEASATMDFEQEDRAPMMALNEVIWHAVKGADVPYPGNSGGVAADADGDGP